MIAEGEHEELEFKQSLRWDVDLRQQNKKLEEVTVKTVAGFTNARGGTLLLGVCDDGKIAGLAPDIAVLGGNRDKFELHLTNLFNKYFGQVFTAFKLKIGFQSAGDKLACRVDVRRSRRPVVVTTGDKNGNAAERCFVRSGNSTQELSAGQLATYVEDRSR